MSHTALKVLQVNSRKAWTVTHSQQFWVAETVLLNPPPLLLPFCLQSLSAHKVLKLSKEVSELFLQPSLGESCNISLLIFLLRPYQGFKLVHFNCLWSHTSHDSQENFLLFFLFSSCSASSSTRLDLESYSRHYLGFGKLNQELPRVNNQKK